MSRPHNPLYDRRIREAQQRVAAQEALVHRMVVQGMPTQAAEDRLRQLQQTLEGMKDQPRRNRASEVQRTVHHHRTR